MKLNILPTLEELKNQKINESKKDDIKKAKDIFQKLGMDYEIDWNGKKYYLTKVNNDSVILSNEPHSENKQSIGISVDHGEFIEKFSDVLNEALDKNEMSNIIYDTLMGNTQHEQFDLNKVTDQEIANDIIKFGYDGKFFKTIIAEIANMDESSNRDEFLVGDATGYLIPDEAELDKLSKDDLFKKLNSLSDQQYKAQVGNNSKGLDELVSASNFIEKYLETKHGVKMNEAYTVNVGKGEIDSQDQALSLIPNQKEVDDEQVDFEEGEKITVTDGENTYKFVWEGGKAVEAPEEEVNEDNMDDAIAAQGLIEKAIDIVDDLVEKKKLDRKWKNFLRDLLSDLSAVRESKEIDSSVNESNLRLDDNMKRIILQALKYFKSGSSSDSNMNKKYASDEEIDFIVNSLNSLKESKSIDESISQSDFDMIPDSVKKTLAEIGYTELDDFDGVEDQGQKIAIKWDENGFNISKEDMKLLIDNDNFMLVVSDRGYLVMYFKK